MSSYPTAYRQGGSSAARAATIPGGFQPWNPGGAPPGSGKLPPWFAGAGRVGLRLAPRFLGAVGVAVTLVELYRWYQGGNGVVLPPGWVAQFECGQGTLFYHTGFQNCDAWGWGNLSQFYSAPDPSWSGFYAYANGGVGPGGPSTVWTIVRGKYYRATGAAPADYDWVSAPPIWGAIPRARAAAQPMPRPGAVPAPPPYVPAGQTPRPAAYPEGSHGGYGAEAPGATRPWNPAVEVTPSGTRTIARPDVRSDPRVPEQKLRLSANTKSFIELFNQYTEYNDAVNALWKALPPGCRAGAEGIDGDKVADILKCWNNINWEIAIFNLVAANFEDQIYAMIGISGKGTGIPYGANTPANIALGKALMDPVSGGIKEIKGAAAAGANKVLGTNIALNGVNPG